MEDVCNSAIIVRKVSPGGWVCLWRVWGPSLITGDQSCCCDRTLLYFPPTGMAVCCVRSVFKVPSCRCNPSHTCVVLRLQIRTYRNGFITCAFHLHTCWRIFFRWSCKCILLYSGVLQFNWSIPRCMIYNSCITFFSLLLLLLSVFYLSRLVCAGIL